MKTTHFGYEEVSVEDKPKRVQNVFSKVHSKYDLMNDLMSFGLHRLWKKYFTLHCPYIGDGSILDIACGTGDIARLLRKKISKSGQIIHLDFNYDMLQEAQKKSLDNGFWNQTQWINARAEELPLTDNSVNLIVNAFGLRNFTDKESALKEMYRVMAPGSRVYILEFSKVASKPLKRLYDLYSMNVIPKIGRLVAQDEESYQYLVESIRMHPSQDELKNMMLESGFDKVHFENINGGIVAIHCGEKY